MEPVKWSQQKSRDVLNEAIEGNISDDLLAAALDVVKDGYEGSLARSVDGMCLKFLKKLLVAASSCLRICKLRKVLTE